LLTRATDTDEKGMTTIVGDNTCNLTAMLHGIFEEHKVHDGVSVIVIIESLLELSGKSCCAWESIVQVLVERGNEVGEDQWLSALFFVEVR
jgi:hypothetical protein